MFITTSSPGYIYRKKLPPCKECSDRKVGCHGSCKAYIDWNEDRLNEKNKAYQASIKERNVDQYEIDRHRRIKKRIHIIGKKH